MMIIFHISIFLGRNCYSTSFICSTPDPRRELTRLAGRHKAPSRGGRPGPGPETSGCFLFVILQSSEDPAPDNSAE